MIVWLKQKQLNQWQIQKQVILGLSKNGCMEIGISNTMSLIAEVKVGQMAVVKTGTQIINIKFTIIHNQTKTQKYQNSGWGLGILTISYCEICHHPLQKSIKKLWPISIIQVNNIKLKMIFLVSKDNFIVHENYKHNLYVVF